MAYLVTEIALEMLGCKYYDIFGTQHDMNDFHVNEHASETSQEMENNLETLLNFNKKPVSTECNDHIQKDKPDEFLTIDESPTVPLEMLIEKECHNVRKQITQQKKDALRKRINTGINEKSTQTMIKNLLDGEVFKLRWETQTLQNFRKNIENTIKEKNPPSYEKYCDMFAKCKKI